MILICCDLAREGIGIEVRGKWSYWEGVVWLARMSYRRHDVRIYT